MTSKEDKEFRSQVIGGSYSCEVCGFSTTGFLHAHHYKHRSQSSALRHEIRNGVRLCGVEGNNCHAKAHSDPKWFEDWMHKNRPADKNYCDNILNNSRRIK